MVTCSSSKYTFFNDFLQGIYKYSTDELGVSKTIECEEWDRANVQLEGPGTKV